MLKARGLRYSALADPLQITDSAVGHYLSGRRQPTIEQVKIIAGVLGMSISDLCGEDAYFVVADDERKAIDAFRKLSEADRQAALMLLRSLEQARRDSESPPST